MRGRERKRLRDALADAVVGAQAAAAEGGRRKTARLGGGVAETRARGLHQVGTYDQSKRRRETPVEWEAGDVKRGRVAGVAQGRGKDNVGGKLAGMKADGTPDRRLRANRKTHGGSSGGSMDLNPPPLPPPHPHPAAGVKRRRAATSRWQTQALDEFNDAARRAARRDGVT